MAKIITRTMNYSDVTFKCYDKTAGNLTEVTAKIECKKGEELITALKSNILGGNFTPVDIVKVTEKSVKTYMSIDEWLKYSHIYTDKTAENNEEI